MRALLNAGPDPNKVLDQFNDVSPLDIATEEGYSEIVQILVAGGQGTDAGEAEEPSTGTHSGTSPPPTTSPPTGECTVNLVVGAGESCTYPGTSAEFYFADILPPMRRLVLMMLAAVAGLAGLVASATSDQAATVEVRVWQDMGDERSLYISARPADGSWATLGTIPLPLDDGTTGNGRYRFGNLRLDVPLANALSAAVEVRVWQHQTNSSRVYISARHAEGSWARLGTVRLPMDDGISASGRYRYSDIRLSVPLPPPIPHIEAIEFFGEFSEDQRERYAAAIGEEFESIATFFANRYGVTSADLTVHLTTSDAPETQGFAFGGGIIWLEQHRLEPTVTEVRGGTTSVSVRETNFLGYFAHEYVHALQAAAGSLGGPNWLAEGMAWYLDSLYSWPSDIHANWFKSRPYLWWQAREWDLPLNDMEVVYFQNGIAYLATERLIERSSEQALFDFYRNLGAAPPGREWQGVFEETFGLSVGEFYEEFEAWREAEVPPPSFFTGTVVSHEGKPLSGIRVSAVRSEPGSVYSYPHTTWFYHSGVSRDDGTFKLIAEPGLTVLAVSHTDCGDAGILDSAGSLTRDPDEALLFTVNLDSISGVTIRLPGPPEDLCAFELAESWTVTMAMGWRQ